MSSKSKEIYKDIKKVSIKVEKYRNEYKDLWDDFVSRSKNGTFLFYRDYMEYHSHRFQDYSLMFFNKNKLIAIMPANIEGKTVVSHSGLTYGGIVSDRKMKANEMLKVFDSLKAFLKADGVNKLIYKAIPHIYHSIPAEEDLYALFRNNAKLIRRDIASTIYLKNRIGYSKIGRWSVNKSKKNNLHVQLDDDFKEFMALKKKDLLEKHGLEPVHTPEEMELLTERFPRYIKLFTIRENGEIIVGMVVYDCGDVIHPQYIASTSRGKELFAADFLINYLIADYYRDKTYFDFGISTENNGTYLNRSLARFKEKFGARGITYDFYKLDV